MMLGTPREEQQEGKARVFVRVLVFWGGYLAIVFLASKAIAMVPPPWNQLAAGLSSGAAIYALTLLFLRREGRGVGDVGLDFQAMSVPRLFLGVPIGLVIFLLNVLLVGLLVSRMRLQLVPHVNLTKCLLAVCTLLALSFMEELGFRGYPLRTLLLRFRPWQAQAIVAVAFGLSHLTSGWSWYAIVFGVIPSALVFGAAAIASRGLALPTGIHAGVNLARWATNGSGVWRIVIDDQARNRTESWASISGIIITLLAALVFWRWRSRPEYE
jgi:hypothetical protein